MKRVVRDKQRDIDREERWTSRTELVGMMLDIPMGLADKRDHGKLDNQNKHDLLKMYYQMNIVSVFDANSMAYYKTVSFL